MGMNECKHNNGFHLIRAIGGNEGVYDVCNSCGIAKLRENTEVFNTINNLQHQLTATQQAYDALRERLKSIETISDNGYLCCPACNELLDKVNGKDHSPDCWLNAEIKGVKENSE